MNDDNKIVNEGTEPISSQVVEVDVGEDAPDENASTNGRLKRGICTRIFRFFIRKKDSCDTAGDIAFDSAEDSVLPVIVAETPIDQLAEKIDEPREQLKELLRDFAALPAKADELAASSKRQSELLQMLHADMGDVQNSQSITSKKIIDSMESIRVSVNQTAGSLLKSTKKQNRRMNALLGGIFVLLVILTIIGVILALK